MGSLTGLEDFKEYKSLMFMSDEITHVQHERSTVPNCQCSRCNALNNKDNQRNTGKTTKSRLTERRRNVADVTGLGSNVSPIQPHQEHDFTHVEIKSLSGCLRSKRSHAGITRAIGGVVGEDLVVTIIDNDLT